MADLPTGTVTLLFTDIEGSTLLLGQLGDAFAASLAEHRRAVRGAFATYGGVEVDTQGDSFFAVFTRASDAIRAATDVQEALKDGPIRVRIGIHTGEPDHTDEGYVGLDLAKGARVCAAGHGGQVLLSQTTRDLIDQRVRDLGEHRLKDLPEPVRIFQLGDESFPPLKSLNQTNLSLQATNLVGRRRELAEAAALLRRDDVRLLTFVGPPGAGKTRLALQLATDVVEEFSDGVFLVGLASLSDASLVPQAIAQTLDVRDGLESHLQDLQVLLLLDNFEHLVDAAPRVSALLAAAPALKLVVTSREPLHLSGEREFPVRPLPEEDAVTLFVERARSVRPDLESSDAVLGICRRLDCLPLAIELAAARTKTLSLGALLIRLEPRLSLLTGGPRDAPARQQTLRATIEWSYGLLTREEQQLLARLTVFVGSFALDTAASLCDADVDGLASLVDKSLLLVQDDRFSMLETIAEFAEERLAESGEAQHFRDRHADTFLAVAEAAEASLEGADHAHTLERLEEDAGNLVSAFEWALIRGQVSRVLRAAAGLRHFWMEKSHIVEGMRLLDAALSRPGGTALERSRAFYALGNLRSARAEYRAALEAQEQALSLGRAAGDAVTVSRALNVIGLILLRLGESNRAHVALKESLLVKQQLGDTRGEAATWNNLGSLAQMRGDLDEAARSYSEGLKLFRQLDDQRGIAVCLENLGTLKLAAGELAEAELLLDEALVNAQAVGSIPNIASTLAGLGELATNRGELERARGLLIEALGLFRRVGDSEAIASTLDCLAACIVVRDAAVAVELLGMSDSLRRSTGAAMWPQQVAIRDRVEAEAALALGRETVAASSRATRSVSPEEAVDYALSKS